MTPARFAELRGRYRALFLDAYGVLRDSGGLLPGIPALLEQLEREGPPWWVVTNDASRAPAALEAACRGLIPARRFVTAGQVAGRWLEQRCPGRLVAYLGPTESADYLRQAGCLAVPLEDLPRRPDPLPAAVALMDEGGFDWAPQLERLVNLLRAHPEVELLVPNPDLVFPRGQGEVGLAAGALAALLERVLGRAPLSFGKPDPAIFAEALARARVELPDLAPAQVLMVGDTLETDVRGARALGLDTALVLTGSTPPERWREAVARSGVTPTWVLEGLLD